MCLYVRVYRPLSSRIHTFFEKLEKSLSRACIKSDMYILMGDLNNDIENPECLDLKEKLCDTFNLTNLIR